MYTDRGLAHVRARQGKKWVGRVILKKFELQPQHRFSQASYGIGQGGARTPAIVDSSQRYVNTLLQSDQVDAHHILNAACPVLFQEARRQLGTRDDDGNTFEE